MASNAQVLFSNGASSATNEQQVAPFSQNDFLQRQDVVWKTLTSAATTTIGVRDLNKCILLDTETTAAQDTVLQLPAASISAGCSLKIQYATATAALTTGDILITIADTTNSALCGQVQVAQAGTTTVVATGVSDGTDTQLTLVGPKIGGELQLFCNGYAWYVSGHMLTHAGVVTDAVFA